MMSARHSMKQRPPMSRPGSFVRTSTRFRNKRLIPWTDVLYRQARGRLHHTRTHGLAPPASVRFWSSGLVTGGLWPVGFSFEAWSLAWIVACALYLLARCSSPVTPDRRASSSPIRSGCQCRVDYGPDRSVSRVTAVN